MNSCPETYLLRGLLDETLPAADRVEIERHVEDCTLCEGVLENLTTAETALLMDPLPGAAPELGEEPDPGLSGRRFRIRKRFDGGGQGDLFIAWDQELEREVALKRIKQQYAADWWRRGELIREALITGRLEHPGIVPVYGLGFDGEGQSYYAMRLVRSLVGRDDRGHTLQDAIAEFHAGRPGWTLRKLLDRFIAVCNTIQYAHDQGVLHCDLKPLNIILGPYGETLVLDWGAARAIVEAPTEAPAEAHPPGHAGRNGHARGADDSPWWQDGGFHLTPAYASPEQLAGRVHGLGQSSDVYSLGAILCCILTGHGPRRGSSGPERPADLRTGPRPADPRTGLRPDWQSKDIPGPLAGICEKALQADPASRYPTVRDLREDVSRWLADEPVSAHRESVLDRLLRLARRHRAWTQAGAAALVLVTLVSLAGFLLVNGARREAVRLSSEMAQDRAIAHFDQGDAQRGVLCLAESLKIEPGGERDPRRLNLAGWSRRLCSLQDFRTLSGATEFLASDRKGRYLLARNADGDARLWSTETGKSNALASSSDGLAVPSFSPDGSMLLAGNRAGEVLIWETAGGSCLRRLKPGEGTATRAVFGPDGKSVLAGDSRGTVRLWDALSGQPLGPPLANPGEIRSLALGRDGRSALVGGMDGKVRLWDATSGTLRAPVMVHSLAKDEASRGVTALALSPDGRTILSGGEDATARFWDASSGAPIGAPLEHLGYVTIAAFSPDGETALTSGYMTAVWLWRAREAKPLARPLAHQGFVQSAEFSPDGKLVLTGGHDMTARIWDAQTGEPRSWPLAHEGSVPVATFSADGGLFRTVSVDATNDDATTRVWQLPRGHAMGVLGPDTAAFDLLEPAGISAEARRKLAEESRGGTEPTRIIDPGAVDSLEFGRLGQIFVIGTHSKVELHNSATGDLAGPVLRTGSLIFSAAMSPDGRSLLTLSSDSIVRIWEVGSDRVMASLSHEGVISAAFHPHPATKIVATGSVDGTARIWSLVNGLPVGEVMKHRQMVQAIAFSPDGRRVLTACRDGSVRQWDALTGQSIGEPLATRTVCNLIRFSANSRLVVVAGMNGRGQIWDIPTGRPVGQTLPHAGAIRAAAFSPGGRLLLTSCTDNRLRLWEVATGRLIGPPILLDDEVRSATFSPDERRVLLGCGSGFVRLLDLLPPLAEDVERLTCWSEVTTGMEIDRDGVLRLLDVGQWHDRRRRLQQLGGPPSL